MRHQWIFVLPVAALSLCALLSVFDPDKPVSSAPVWAKVADPCAGAVRNASIAYDLNGARHVAIVCNNSEVWVR